LVVAIADESVERSLGADAWELSPDMVNGGEEF
jgi:hypothetical protein